MLESGMDELLNMGTAAISRATRTALADMNDQDVREAPGVIHVITAADIKAANCRDLQEALMLVPSYMPGRDVDDVVGFAIRGQWAHEGKCLYQLNGMPLNDASFGILAMGMCFPLESIARIEVINGPGSVIHGGFAAVGVVNIITKDLRDEEGLTLSTSTGVVHGTPTTQRGHLYGTHRIGSTTELSYGASLTMGPRFISRETDQEGMTLNYTDSTRSQCLNGFFSIRRKNFRGQFYVIDQNVQVSDMPYDLVMRTTMASGEQRIALGKRSRLDLGLLHRLQLPWFYGNGASSTLNLTNTVDQRSEASATLISQPLQWLTFTVGGQAWLDRFDLSVRQAGNVFNVNGKNRLSIWDAALFGEIRARSSFGSFIAGARAEHHSITGLAGAPRFGYTTVVKRVHAKLLYSASFKVPTMQNINVGPVDDPIRREYVWTREVEVGYRMGKATQVNLAAFHTLITDPIVYVYQGDSGVQDSYLNRRSSATQGFEATLRHTGRTAMLQGTLSYYEVDVPATDLPETTLPEGAGPSFLGLPRYKASVIAHMKMGDRMRIGADAVWCSSSESYQPDAQTEAGMSLRSYPAWVKAGLNVERAFRRPEGMSITVGCRNILDERSWIQSTYNNGLASLPVNGRELTFRLEYRFAL